MNRRPKLTKETLPLYVEASDPGICWNWVRPTTKGGYGAHGNTTAHRYVFSLFGGKIPVGKELDHLCRNIRCVNPSHLEPVSHSENQLRSPLVGYVGDLVWKKKAREPLCSKGHDNWSSRVRLSGRYIGRPYRFCLTCSRETSLQWYYVNKRK